MYQVHDQTLTATFLTKESLCRSIEYVANGQNPFSYSQRNNAYSINCGVLLGELAWMGTLFNLHPKYFVQAPIGYGME